MKVAVITPYHKARRDWLEQCHQSVLQQTYPCTHFLVADGYPEDYVDSWNAQHIVLKKCHSDFGDTPRGIGSISAIGQGFDAIAYLDDDNWYHPKHIESLVELHHQTKAPVCFSSRLFTRLDGTPLGKCPITHSENFIDTSCYLFTKVAFSATLQWSFIPPQYHALDDRMILLYLKKNNIERAFSNLITLAYRTKHPGDYLFFDEKITVEPNEKAKFDRIGLACRLFKKETGIDLKIKKVRKPHKYDGTFWDGKLCNS